MSDKPQKKQNIRMIDIALVNLDEKIYPRERIDEQLVEIYCFNLEAGIDLPPLVVQKNTFTLIDGFHRYHAAKRLQEEKVAQLTIEGVNVDLYVATPETWEPLLLIRTGSAEHNIKLSMRARKLGMKLAHRGLVKNGRIIASTEKRIFEALGMEYVPPEERN